jgi:subtilisin family serine protease
MLPVRRPRALRLMVCFLAALVGLATVFAPPATPDADPTPPLDHAAHLERLGVPSWHRQGYRGQGVKIAILDTGFHGWRQYLGKQLPVHVTTRSFRSDGNLEAKDSQHGILCAEIIHTLAPDAELLFANWDAETPATFLEAVRWAKAAGARVLTCSVIMPGWSDGEGGGPVHFDLDAALGDDVLFFASAGNTAQRHWCGSLHPDAEGWHQWGAFCINNTLQPWGGERVAVEVYGPLGDQLELQILGKNGGVVCRAPLTNTFCNRRPWSHAVAKFDPDPGEDYHVCLKCSADHKSLPETKLHVVALGGNLEYCRCGGSIPFPADGARVLAVGAVDRRGLRAPYSACGPNSQKPKPDFVALVPFPSQCRLRPFSGTSAAAPQAAALAALVWSRQPQANASQVSGFLRGAALDLGPRGHDWETGYGLIRLPAVPEKVTR